MFNTLKATITQKCEWSARPHHHMHVLGFPLFSPLTLPQILCASHSTTTTKPPLFSPRPPSAHYCFSVTCYFFLRFFFLLFSYIYVSKNTNTNLSAPHHHQPPPPIFRERAVAPVVAMPGKDQRLRHSPREVYVLVFDFISVLPPPLFSLLPPWVVVAPGVLACEATPPPASCSDGLGSHAHRFFLSSLFIHTASSLHPYRSLETIIWMSFYFMNVVIQWMFSGFFSSNNLFPQVMHPIISPFLSLVPFF